MKKRIVILMCLLGIFWGTTCLNGKYKMLTKYNYVTAGSIEELSGILEKSTLYIKPSINRNVVKNTTPDDFLTVTVDDKEYAIKYTKTIKTHANCDDTKTHTTILCENNFIQGNILR